MLNLNFKPFPEITTERLLLRKMTKQDAEEMFFLRSDENVMKYIDRPRAASMQDARGFPGSCRKIVWMPTKAFRGELR